MWRAKKKLIKRLLFIVFMTGIAISTAYILGVEAGGFLNAKKIEESSMHREHFRNLILDKNETLTIGGKLPNYFFRNLNGDYVELEKIVKSPTLITYFLADCASCFEQIEILSGLSITDKSKLSCVFISHSNPFELIEVRNKYKIDWPILYDHWNQYGSNLQINTYPFNIVVDSGLVIRDLIPSSFQEYDFKGVMNLIAEQ